MIENNQQKGVAIAMRQFPLFKIFCKIIKREKVKMNELYEVVVLRR
jgi:hypothetical protein